MAADDPVRVETALFYTLALKNAKVPVELHVYSDWRPWLRSATVEGMGHHLPQRAADWMRSRGWLAKESPNGRANAQ